MPKKQRANYFNFSGGLDTDSSILNRNPITVTDIDNCNLNTDGSISSRGGIEANTLASAYNDSYLTSTYVPPSKVYLWEFKDDTGVKVTYTVVRTGTAVSFYIGDVPQGTPDYTLDTNTSNFDYMDIVFEGNVAYVPNVSESGGVYTASIDKVTYTNSSGLTKTSSSIRYRESTYLAPIFNPSLIGGPGSDYYSRKVCSSENFNIHPFEEGNTVWSDETPSSAATLPEYQFNIVYASGEKVKVTNGTFHMPTSFIPSDVTLEVGTHVKLIQFGSDDAVKYDTIRNVYENGSDTVVILENLSTLGGSFYVSNIVGLKSDSPTYPKFMCAALGRLFISPNTQTTRVYYSQIFSETESNSGKFYTEANPYDPGDSSVVASDGGYFEVSGIDYITGIKESSGAILIFGNNGVWEAIGADGLFRPDNYTVRKITDKGCISPASIEYVEGGVVYVSTDGVNVITKNEVSGLSSKVTSLTDGKLENFFSDLPRDNKHVMSTTYNPTFNELYILYNENIEVAPMVLEGTNTHYRNILVYKLKLGAWYKWSLPIDAFGTKLSLADIWMTNSNDSGLVPVVDGAANVVVSDTGDFVTTANYVASSGSLEAMAYLNKNVPADSSILTTYGKLRTRFVYDFENLDDDREYIEPYFSSAHQTYSDIMRGKLANYIKILYEVLPDFGKDAHGIDNLKGGCNLRVSLDMADSPEIIVNGWGQDRATNSDYGISYSVYPAKKEGYSHQTFKHKVLGRGNVLQFNFEGVTDKRYFKALGATQGDSPILDDGLLWEEIAEDDLVSELEWDVSTAYVLDDTCKVTHPSNFHIVGWSCELIPTESVTTAQ